MARRSQPYRLRWPLSAQQVENIDEMFQLLFDDTQNGTLDIRPAQIDFVLTVEQGGTGISEYVVGDILYASDTDELSTLAGVATGNALISGGVATAPSWGKIGLTTHVDGVLPVANGGTNISSYTIGDLLYASGATALSKLAGVAAGSYLRSGGVATAPVWSTITLPNTGAQGDIPYVSATNVVSMLTKDTNSSRYLSNTGASNAPAWAQVSLSTGVTGDLPLTNIAQQAGAAVLGVATGPNTPAYVAGSHAHQLYGSSASARTCAYGGALTPGSLLVVTVTTTTTTTGNTCSDSVNGAYTLAAAQQDGTRRVEIFYFPNNASSGTPTVTVTPSATSFLSIAVDEYTGCELSSVVRAFNSGTGSDASAETGTVASSAGDLIVIGAMEYSGTQTVSGTTGGVTQVDNIARVAGTSTGLFTLYRASGAGSDASVLTLTGAGSWVTVIVAFKPASGTSDLAMITAASDHQVLRRSGISIGFGQVNLAQSAAVTGALPLANGGTGQTSTTQTYTPSLTNVTNVAASTAYACQYHRVGNVITVSGKVDIDPTAAGATELGLSLPVASDFATEQQLGGVAQTAAVAGEGVAIRADTTNNRAALVYTAVDTANKSWFFTFTYQVV